MATIKKAFTDLIDLLEANKDKRVSTILPDVIELASAKTGAGGGKASTFHRNEAGEVVAVRCFYHRLWMDPRVVDFGAKKTSASGLNSMCKEGVSNWTKQQAAAKKAESELLARVAAGEVKPADIAAEQERIAAAKAEVKPREDGYGFETLEECLADSEARGL